MSEETRPSERPRLQLKPRDPTAAQAYELQRARSGSNPFGAAKPREQVIAERLGKTEEEVLKETFKKERPKLRLNAEQLEQRKQAEARIDEARSRLVVVEEAGRRELEVELQTAESELEALLDCFEALALEAAQRGEVQRPSERRQQQGQGQPGYSGGSEGGRVGCGRRDFGPGGERQPQESAYDRERGPSRYDRQQQPRAFYERVEGGDAAGGRGGYDRAEPREYDRHRGGYDRAEGGGRGGYAGDRGCGSGGERGMYERVPREPREPRKGGYERFERGYEREGRGVDRTGEEYKSGARGGRGGGDWGAGYSRGSGHDRYERRGGSGGAGGYEQSGQVYPGGYGGDMPRGGGHAVGVDDSLRGGYGSSRGSRSGGRSFSGPTLEELTSSDYVSPYTLNQDRF
ncbi:hypothetical protein Agub_g3936 [Astrephomene gubernaculifera]|uniref:Uncharacterized protein n=1 Tax=Astrephomene gubernaculifera TaxID=47775 RepID=A0AAD3DJS2_9CHLO|nr:hypothetical protein Agub_g3936 [Astrephomene gubernaculifera]